MVSDDRISITISGRWSWPDVDPHIRVLLPALRRRGDEMQLAQERVNSLFSAADGGTDGGTT